MRVGGSARARTARDNCPLQLGLAGSLVLPGGTGRCPPCTLSCVPGSWSDIATALPGNLILSLCL